jgi:DNA-binding beta-propeller fold protein YncE
MKELAEWPVKPCQENAMVALDETRKRLYVVCRKPGMVVVMNSDNGVVLSAIQAPLRADDVLFDPTSHRLYVPGGEGYVGVYDTADADHLKLIANVRTAPGAKTGILLPDRKQLILQASPGETKAIAKLLVYNIQ